MCVFTDFNYVAQYLQLHMYMCRFSCSYLRIYIHTYILNVYIHIYYMYTYVHIIHVYKHIQILVDAADNKQRDKTMLFSCSGFMFLYLRMIAHDPVRFALYDVQYDYGVL
jgi:hypothetical protein